MQLRPYQSQALEACWDFLRHREGNPALVLPTGAGKSPLMAAIAQEAVQQWGGRVGVLAHVQELIEQNSGKLRALWPEAPMGIYAAGLRRRDRFDKILYMQIQSVAKRAHELGRFDLLLVDEAHRIPLKSEGLYTQFINDCRRFNPALRVVGLTATPYRLQGQAVPVCGPQHVLTDVAYEARITDLIADGYLSRLVSKAGERPDLSAVHQRGGEYVEGELADAMMPLVERTCDDLLARASDRRAWIVFCVNVKHAEAVRDALVRRGITAAVVSGETPKGERARLIGDFQSGGFRALVNVNVLSEGFDAPHIDCVAMLRPTKSPGLYYQQVGRGFRLAPGKADCLVLDYAGNMLEHGPVDAIRVRPARPKKASHVERGTAKECPKCQALLPLGARQCECGHSFASADPAHSDRPVDAPVLSTFRERAITTHTVHSVAYSRHEKPGKTPSLRATYQCGMRRFSEWICIEHAGTPRAKALRWWQARTADQCPRTVEEALPLAWKLPSPLSITVDETDKYPEILGHEFAPTEPQRAPDTDLGSLPDTGGTGSPARPDAVPGVRGVPGWLVQAVEATGARKRAA
ncbi:DEAD/DEAH box helicase family protein [Luteibacter sp. E-22]|uniref:DEAD/DEAH box helicase n=1 Tax=Luteibacter sp. E-22 TaxID=3404050 RepID=UPI003CFB0213